MEDFDKFTFDDGDIEEFHREDGDGEDIRTTIRKVLSQAETKWPFANIEISYEFGVDRLEKIRRYVNLTLRKFIQRLERKYCLTDLDAHNPGGNAKVPIGEGWLSWHSFLNNVTRDCFPDITTNRFHLFQFVLEEVIIPIYKKKPKEVKKLFTDEKIKELQKKARDLHEDKYFIFLEQNFSLWRDYHGGKEVFEE